MRYERIAWGGVADRFVVIVLVCSKSSGCCECRMNRGDGNDEAANVCVCDR